MEKIMSKTNDTCRELTIDELEAVSGGADYITHSIDTPSISGDGGGGGGGGNAGTAIAAWNKCLGVFGY
jgi:bacteriocin-like protein